MKPNIKKLLILNAPYLLFVYKEKYYRNLRNPWLFLLLMFALFAVTKQSIIFGIFALVSVIPGSIYQIQIMKIRKEAKTQEW